MRPAGSGPSSNRSPAGAWVFRRGSTRCRRRTPDAGSAVVLVILSRARRLGKAQSREDSRAVPGRTVDEQFSTDSRPSVHQPAKSGTRVRICATRAVVGDGENELLVVIRR